LCHPGRSHIGHPWPPAGVFPTFIPSFPCRFLSPVDIVFFFDYWPFPFCKPVFVFWPQRRFEFRFIFFPLPLGDLPLPVPLFQPAPAHPRESCSVEPSFENPFLVRGLSKFAGLLFSPFASFQTDFDLFPPPLWARSQS